MDTQRDAVEVDDYSWDDPVHDSTLRLLDYRGAVADEIPGQAVPMAKIAAAIHESARYLTADQHEQVIGWLKTWKLCDIPRKYNESTFESQFARRLNWLKASEMQTGLLSKVKWSLFAAKACAILLALCAATVAVVFFDGHTWRWYESFGAFVVFVAIYAICSTFDTKAQLAAKEQDRRYFLASLREAQTVSELSQAGLFAFIPESTPQPGRPFNEWASVLAMRSAQEHLSDALYTDPDWFLRR
ncbi:hypothetical protein AWB68_00500 [Caballeronia choica]|uniref:Uncharacterized protein n=1 Tax=Caballeronia choica TaxID=326476 RepID=A0A158FCC4_9BURK|nr:hypothetical protein [Caballeronia choica]SAL17464.1 hypothetical protein AWB68_00500 [Caballeronia choica]